MSAVIGVIAVAAMAEAGWNLGTFVYGILHLPVALAAVFPVIAEATASSFAVQDLRDRRQGVPSTGLRVATYVTLAVSAAVNGVVGAVRYGPGGLLEVLAPLALGAVVHLHGDRATRAYQSRAQLSPRWREEQVRAARLESVVEVLPLLTGDDEDGRATVALLRRRLLTATLEPGEALIAAGWDQRHTRDMSASRLRRLEAVAATVWGPTRPQTPTPSRRAPANASPSPSPHTSPAPTRRAVTGARSSTTHPGAQPGEAPRTRQVDDVGLAELVAQTRAERPGAGEGSVRALLRERALSASSRRIRDALAAHPHQ